jgi:hypothetical protein
MNVFVRKPQGTRFDGEIIRCASIARKRAPTQANASRDGNISAYLHSVRFRVCFSAPMIKANCTICKIKISRNEGKCKQPENACWCAKAQPMD